MRRALVCVPLVCLAAAPVGVALAADRDGQVLNGPVKTIDPGADPLRPASYVKLVALPSLRASARAGDGRRGDRSRRRHGRAARVASGVRKRSAAVRTAGDGQAGGVAVPPALQAIAACESGGNPRAIGGGGAYRGKYQFDYGTWASVGGSGDPAAAPEAEQDRRAALLYARAGSSPWPSCG